MVYVAGISEVALVEDRPSLVQAVKAQFRVLSRSLHPDKQPGRRTATKDFQLLKTAKECLEGESSLARYLKKLRAFRTVGKFQVFWNFTVGSSGFETE